MPFHTQIVITLISGSIVFCLALGLMGFLFRRKASELQPEPIFPGSKFPGVFSIFYTVFFIVTFGMAAVQGYIQQTSDSPPEPNLIDIISSAALQLLLYMPFICVYFAQPSMVRPAASIPQMTKWILLGLLAMILPSQILELYGFSEWVVQITGCPLLQDVVNVLATGEPEIRITMIVLAVIVAPFTEECFFRGFVYNILKQWNGPVSAAIASSILFGAVHASLPQFLPLTLFAIVQCIAYEKARSLWLPITLHILFNGLSALAILFFM